MYQPFCIAIMLAGLWNLLALITVLRERDIYARESTRPIFFPTYRRQRQLSIWMVAAATSTPLLCIALANLPGLSVALLPGAAFGLHLFLGVSYVHQHIGHLPRYERSEDPNLHVLSLALLWPLWALRESPLSEG